MTTPRRAAVLSIGDELMLGQITDTNAPWLLARLAEAGYVCLEQRTLPDDRAAIADAIAALGARTELLVITGGLGPTLDDLTRDALGDVVAPGEALEVDPAAVEHLERLFRHRGRVMPQNNNRQTLRPRGSRMLDNPLGTAMGISAWHGGCRIVCLPGPPREMQPMFEAEVLTGRGFVSIPSGQRGPGEAIDPSGAPDANDTIIATAAVHEIGLGESAAAERLGDLMQRDREVLVGTTASGGIVSARIRATGRRAEATRAVRTMALEVERCWQPYAFGHDGLSLAEAVGSLLRSAAQTLAVAESCTGGLLGAMLVDQPGASDVFRGGWIVYSNEMKERELDVPADMLKSHGAVSAPVAERLAIEAMKRSGSDHALAITGIAGPGGGSAEKPVGTVFIGAAHRAEGIVRARRFLVTGDRRDIRERSARIALQVLRLHLVGAGDVPLLWEVRSGSAP